MRRVGPRPADTSRPQHLAGPVQAHPCRDLADAERGGGLGERELVDGDEFQDGAFTLGEPFQGGEGAAPGALGVELVLETGDVVGLQQPSPRDAHVAPDLTGGPSALRGDDVAGDAVEPGPFAAQTRPVGVGGVQDGEKGLCGQVGHGVGVGDTPGHERRHPSTCRR